MLTPSWRHSPDPTICIHRPALAEAVGDPPSTQVIRAEFDQHAVSEQDADVVHPHASRDPGEDVVPICQFDIEHGVWARLADGPLDLNDLFLFLRLTWPTCRTSSSDH